ncbi:MAG: type III pantothenate kinase [Bacteroidales bacterium]|nr:type III pantothenate kinase [Bacteroidales bacterium]MCF8333512.1 type III pantothenate kinase [Bacteroidales bacterium]
MNLVIDIGNTDTKIGVFQGDHLYYQSRYKKLDDRELAFFFQHYAISQTIVSNVSSGNKSFVDYFNKNQKDRVIFLNSSTPMPLKISYKTPETLGSDRLAAAVGAKHLYPAKPVLVIDVGSCITYDFVTAEGEYRGGAIAPGLNMRYQAMHQFTGNLPLLQPKEETPLTGDTTNASMHSGVLNGTFNEVDGMIDQFRKEQPGVTVIITGGNINNFDKKLKNNIFASPNIVLTGLNQILKYNIEDKKKI